MYKVSIIGCGSIGAMKPDHIDFPGSENILTHANAVTRHPKTELVAFIDSDFEKVKKAGEKWGIPSYRLYSNLSDMYVDQNPDIVICAVPTEQHANIFGQLHKRCRIIIAEKPFCTYYVTAKRITDQYELDNIPIMVDYIRRFAKEYQKFKKLVDSGTFGSAINCRVLYTRGISHEACHAIDLMHYFFGKCLRVDKLSRLEIIDRTSSDPTIPVSFAFEKCTSVIFQPCDGREYGIFEIDICFQKGRFRFIDNGLFLEYYPINEENEWGHKSLSYKLTDVIRQETWLNLALYNVIDNAVNFLDGTANLICTAKDALEVHKVLERINWRK